MAIRVHHLDCGQMDPVLGGLVFDDPHHRHMVCHCVLVELDDTLVLIDSGIGLQDVARPWERLGGWFMRVVRPRLRPELTARARIEALGFDPDDVGHVVLTHLDLDHAGGLADFPRARVHVMRDEHDQATRRPTAHDRNRYRPTQWEHAPAWSKYETDGEDWQGFRCVRDLEGLPPEILMVPVVGHSAGHAAVAVQTRDGWLLHCGDAYFHRGEMDPDRLHCTPGLAFFQWLVAYDRQTRLENRARLRELAARPEGDVRLFSAHDPIELARLRG